MDALEVACRMGHCVWHGKLGAYRLHSCPSPVSPDDNVLMWQRLMLFDERLDVKIDAFRMLACRVFRRARGAVNERYLSMLYMYSVHLDEVDEIQHICIQVLNRVLSLDSGVLRLQSCCDGLLDRLVVLFGRPDLREDVLRVARSLAPDYVGNDEFFALRNILQQNLWPARSTSVRSS